jgi:hypothetical protein
MAASSSLASVLLPASTSLLVLDFDDSLFPTTHGHDRGWHIDTVTRGAKAEAQSCLADTGRVIEKILHRGKKAGACCVLTAASRSWVLENVAMFMPDLLPLFMIDKGAHRPRIEIMSAADHYGQLFPDDPFEWKLRMLELLLQHWIQKIAASVTKDNQARRLIVVSIGDAEYERDATQQLIQKHQHTALTLGVQLFGKTIKLMDEPEIEELGQQLEHVHAALDPLLFLPHHLEAEFYREA